MGTFEEAVKGLRTAVDGSRGHLDSENLASSYVGEIVCPALRKVLNNLRVYKVEESETGEDNLVIHYTSIAALVSMFQDAPKDNKKSSLRLYDSVNLNDPDEGNYFTRNFKLPEKYDWLGKREENHAYIASFIMPATNHQRDMSNDLVFWCAYGKEGKGCSLALPVPRSRLQRVLYGEEGLKCTVGELGTVLDYLDPLVETNNPSIQEKLVATVWESLERIRYLHKNQAYDYENECRFVVAESDIRDKHKICFEDQDRNNFPTGIRHYFESEELGIEKLLITGSSITLGPCVSQPYNVKYYLKTLMSRANLEGPDIKISDIPYRKS